MIYVKKEIYYQFKNPGNTNSGPTATSNNSISRKIQGKCPDGTALIVRDSVKNAAIQKNSRRKDILSKCRIF